VATKAKKVSEEKEMAKLKEGKRIEGGKVSRRYGFRRN